MHQYKLGEDKYNYNENLTENQCNIQAELVDKEKKLEKERIKNEQLKKKISTILGLSKDLEDKKKMFDIKTITANVLEKLMHSLSCDHCSVKKKNPMRKLKLPAVTLLQ